MLDKPRLLLAGLVGLVAVYLANYAVPGLEKDLPALHHLVRFAAPFAFGVAAHVWRDRVPYSPVLGLGLVLIAVGLDGTGLAQLAGAVALCYAILLIGLAPTGPFATTNFLGQFSYGVYVYGFPIQQLVVHLGLGTTPLTNGLISLAIVVPLAGLSWTWVEQPLLRLKRPLAERLRALAPAAAPTEVPKAVAEPVPERRAA
jgi:peptidoglycan/LPS O-acetylase OafA/YrhL